MEGRQRFSVEKAIEAILFVAKAQPDMYRLLKLLYFADKLHLSRYGRLITGDYYVAMQHGPVPSNAYDIIKYVRGDGIFRLCECTKAQGAFVMKRNRVLPQREPDLSFLSESDRECLDEAIKMYGPMSFRELCTRSHDKAYSQVGLNDVISLESIAKQLPNGELVLDYLRN